MDTVRTDASVAWVRGTKIRPTLRSAGPAFTHVKEPKEECVCLSVSTQNLGMPKHFVLKGVL